MAVSTRQGAVWDGAEEAAGTAWTRVYGPPREAVQQGRGQVCVPWNPSAWISVLSLSLISLVLVA